MNNMYPEHDHGRADFYRYFLGCKPDAPVRKALARIAQDMGQPMACERLHLTFCIVVEGTERDCLLAQRLDHAFAGRLTPSATIRLGRVIRGPHGAMAVTTGRQDETQALYRLLVARLALCGFAPVRRKARFQPHVTLGYRSCPGPPLDIALDWTPDELLLIESEVGLTRHNVLRRWPLSPPRQAAFNFSPRPANPAAGPARRSAA